MVSSPSGSLVQRAPWCVALGLAAALFVPGPAQARFELQDDPPPSVTYSIDGTAGTNGWYVSSSIVVHWSVSGSVTSTSGCEPAISVADPDTGSTLTCTASGPGGTTSVTTKTLKVDATPPSTTVSSSRAPNSAGWYRAAVTLTWAGTDSTSGLASCTSPLSYSGPDAASTSQTGSCTDNAGNSSNASLTLHYDSTPPATTASPSPAPNANGWLKSGIQVTWNGTDTLSGLAGCDAKSTYSGPDTAGSTLSGSCTDVAGNSSSASFLVRMDTASPTTTAIAARAPSAAGWYRAPILISGSGTDPLSGVDSCTSSTYGGPDTSGSSVLVSCKDKAGNSSSNSYVVNYDSTPPVTTAVPDRAPNEAGWFNSAVTINGSGTDSLSGIDSCAPTTYNGPDTAGTSKSVTCTDKAGNSSTGSYVVKYDSTPPTVAVAAARVPDDNGWYNHAVGISWTGTDATSGIASCNAPVTYSGPDTKNASSSGGCTDKAGNPGTPPPFSIKYDATPPVATAVPDRGADANGWYNHSLTIGWSSSDPVSGIASCTSTTYAGPDSASVDRSGTCTDGAGNTSAAVPFGFQFDSTPPTSVSAGPARPPDHDGWYNRPLAVRWSGADALSGIASCSTATYGGPTSSASAVNGSCTDQAGNTSGAVGYAFKYDSTPPAFGDLDLTPRDDSVSIRWRTSGATDFKVTRKPGIGGSASSLVYDGRASSFADRKVDNYVRYTYTLTAEDDAGNVLTHSGATMPMPVLYAPRPNARISSGSVPLLAWRPARKAGYYNVQLWLDGHAIGSWWPAGPRLKLPARWRFGGSPHTLAAGSYTWYVWPGRGPRRIGRYWPLLGKSTFVVGSG